MRGIEGKGQGLSISIALATDFSGALWWEWLLFEFMILCCWIYTLFGVEHVHEAKKKNGQDQDLYGGEIFAVSYFWVMEYMRKKGTSHKSLGYHDIFNAHIVLPSLFKPAFIVYWGQVIWEMLHWASKDIYILWGWCDVQEVRDEKVQRDTHGEYGNQGERSRSWFYNVRYEMHSQRGSKSNHKATEEITWCFFHCRIKRSCIIASLQQTPGLCHKSKTIFCNITNGPQCGTQWMYIL